MPKANPKKTKSAHKPLGSQKFVRVAIGAVVVIIVVWAVVLGAGLRSDAPKADYLLQTRNQTYRLEAARSGEAQTRGLGARASLGEDAGMIFVFEREGNRCFWMKDMQFPIDIIWVGDKKQVNRIAEKVQPSSYPNVICAEAIYVIELNSGHAAKASITRGAKLDF